MNTPQNIASLRSQVSTNNSIPTLFNNLPPSSTAARQQDLKSGPNNNQINLNDKTMIYPSPAPSKDDSFADLDYIITQIVRCDNFFCEQLSEMYIDSIFLAISIKYPEIQKDLVQCGDERGMDHELCQALFLEAVNRVNPMVYDLIDQKRRAISPDPLVNYDGLQYVSPFWFEGAGDVWRRIDGHSKRTSLNDCVRVKKDLDLCLSDPLNKHNSHCFTQYGHAQICEPGVNCPYLRYPMTTCFYNDQVTDYRTLDNCLHSIPKFHRCKDGFVPEDANI